MNHSTAQRQEEEMYFVFTPELRFVIPYFKGLDISWACSLNWKCEEEFSFARVHKAVSVFLAARHL